MSVTVMILLDVVPHRKEIAKGKAPQGPWSHWLPRRPSGVIQGLWRPLLTGIYLFSCLRTSRAHDTSLQCRSSRSSRLGRDIHAASKFPLNDFYMYDDPWSTTRKMGANIGHYTYSSDCLPYFIRGFVAQVTGCSKVDDGLVVD